MNELLTAVDLRKIINEDDIKKSLEVKFGKDAVLQNWEVDCFTKDGDNHASRVVAVVTTFTKNGHKQWGSFIVKIFQKSGFWNKVQSDAFDKEIGFYQNIVPLLNESLKISRQPELRVPKLLHVVQNNDSKLMFFEDLRDQGFKMLNKGAEVTSHHINLIMEELGRLHSASVYIIENSSAENLISKYPCLEEPYFKEKFEKNENMQKWAKSMIESRSSMLGCVEGYKNAAAAMKKLDFFADAKILLKTSKPFQVICHSDCWINNILFRYNEYGTPVEVRLVDFQLTRIGSPATDLNYFMFNCVSGNLRKKLTGSYLSTYYSSFNTVLAGRDTIPLFSNEELLEEYKRMNKYGFLMALVVIPIILCDEKNLGSKRVSPEISNEERIKISNQMKKNKLFRSRFLEMIDTMIEEKILEVNDEPKEEEKKTCTPHELITDYAVKKALEASHGNEAELRTWDIHDFTNKGDNYAAFVTSVTVTYLLKGKKDVTSFIVKVNPCSGIMSETADLTFSKESHFYTDVIPLLNKQLNVSGQAALRFPKCLYVSLESRKQVIILEDLRNYGYKMLDRKIGLDVPHLNLVLMELGKLHAASVLLKGSQPRESFLKCHPYLHEPFFRSSFVAEKGMNAWCESLIENAALMLEAAGGCEDTVKSIRETKMLENMEKQLISSPPMEVICHGDCWTNNLLFKYDDHGSPIGLYLIDVQMTRVSSLGTDWNYLMFNSVPKELRDKHFKLFAEVYCSSFSQVLAGVNQSPTFSKEDVIAEYKNKMLFGFLSAIMCMPIMLSDPEDVVEFSEFEMKDAEAMMELQKKTAVKQIKNSPLIRERFLGMIQEMVENGILKGSSSDQVNKLDEKDAITNPHLLVTEKGVEMALHSQHGPDAVLRSWEVKDFTKKGDNYSAVVSSVNVNFLKNKQKMMTSFIVKLNPCAGMMKDEASTIFQKESKFYSELLPKLNFNLKNAGHSPLKVPQYLYSDCSPQREIIYFEDMREKGFKMADRRKGLSCSECILILKELGRLHASSHMMKGCRTNSNMKKEYPYLKEVFLKEQDNVYEQFLNSETTASMLEAVNGYEKIAKVVREMNFYEEMKLQLNTYSDNINVICHGDCWTNNVLFKYDANESPIDCCLLDFQIIRYGSPGMDLNYLLINSVDGTTRRKHLDTFFSIYTSSFNSVISGVGQCPYFGKELIVAEYKSKQMFGLIMGALAIPFMLSDDDEVVDLTAYEEKDMDAFKETHKDKNIKQIKNNPFFRPRFLDMVDEMVEAGVININK